MSRISKKLWVGKIAYVEITTNELGTLSIEVQDESGGICPLDINYEDAIKLAKLINEMAKEIKKQPDWR